MPPLSELDRARPHIEAALSYASGTHTFEDVAADISAGRAILWPGENSAVVTRIVEHPRKRTLHFFLAGGNLAELEVMLPIIMQWGRERGCSSASLTGRRGWERTFLTKKEGWHADLVVLTKDLTDVEGRR